MCNSEHSSDKKTIKVWDTPTRLFHWSLTIGVVLCWLSMHQRWLDLHLYSGYFVLFLLIFRLIWGIAGSRTSRFIDFVVWPLHALKYLKNTISGEVKFHAGHNPAGGWMVVAMLLLILIQIATGLFSNDDIGFSGPLADIVTKDRSDWATQLHALLFNSLLAFIWLHLVAVFFYYFVNLQNLIKSIITGEKTIDEVGNTQHLHFASIFRAILGCIVSLSLTLLIINWKIL